MTERSANVRVNVTGNAAAELAKVDNAVKRVGADAAAAAPKWTKTGQALGKTAQNARSLTAATGKLGEANKRTATSFDGVSRAIDKANAAARSFSANSRVAAPTATLTTWQRIAQTVRQAADAAGRMARTQVTGGTARAAGRVIGALGSLAGVGLDTARGAGSTLGIASRDQLAGQFVDQELDRIRLANQAHLDAAGRRQLGTQITGAARGSLQSPEAIQAALSTAQNRFSNLEFFAENATSLARASTALGTDMDSIVGAVGEFNRSMGVRANEVDELVGVMEQQAEQGSIEARDIATSFAGSIGMFQRVTGDTGMRGMRSFGAVAQTLGTGTASAAEAATLMENLLGKLANPAVMRGLQRAGIQTQEQARDAAGNLRTDARGRPVMEMRDLGAIFADMAAHQTLGSSEGARRRIFGNDLQANQAVGIILSRIQEASAAGQANPLTALAGVSGAEGNAVIGRTMADINGSAAGGVLRARVNAEANFQQNGEALVRQMTSMAGAVSDLDTRFPRLSMATDTVRGAFSTLTGTLGAMNLAAGANAATGAASVGGAAGGGSAGAAIAAGTAAFAGTVALQDALQGHASRNVRHEGLSASEAVADFFSGRFSLFDGPTATMQGGQAGRVASARRESQQQAQGNPHAAAALAAQQETNRHLARIAGNTAGQGGNPATVTP